LLCFKSFLKNEIKFLVMLFSNEFKIKLYV
jgi:hypothetical protein